ncbi:MAG: hypothetical protein DELT_00547 [Desulfovibrio sp.]
MDSREKIERDLAACFDAQLQTVADWHESEPRDVSPEGGNDVSEKLRKLILAQHWKNYQLWHTEDIARRKDVDFSVIADCKYTIDKFNQQRNDAFEAVDEFLVNRLKAFLPQAAEGRPRYNTESLGMAIDRLSILALKIYHMAEQVSRQDVTEEHRKSCADKLAVLKEQRGDLQQSVFDLVDEFCSGAKQPKAYYQFKMYNDPALNPQLYENT